MLCNPFLPLDVCIPDGEPHIFGDRLYIFGSHDALGGDRFCPLPYESWSAPLSDLSAWRRDGVIYSAQQDPDYCAEKDAMYAPDVVQGPDGRYYLYYSMAGFTNPIQVAVCDTPAGRYEYYGAVRTPDGQPLRQGLTFDPAVTNENGCVRLYYGWSLADDETCANLTPEQLAQMDLQAFDKHPEDLPAGEYSHMGANVVELEADMLTVKGDVKRIVPGQYSAYGTSFEEHPFFEASSVRKIGDTYYFIYSSRHQHELCYATSKYPDRDFVYQGRLISNGDLGLDGNTARRAITGNNHGSLIQLNSSWYIFYHRQTHKTTFSRQACAEPIQFENGKFFQAELTSSGLAGTLPAAGRYPAPICCHLYRGEMPHQNLPPITQPLPHITHSGSTHYIAEVLDGTVIRYRYFAFDGAATLKLCVRGSCDGTLTAAVGNSEPVAVKVYPSAEWTVYTAPICATGCLPLTLEYTGAGMLEL